LKNWRNRSTVWWTESTAPAHRSMDSTLVIDSLICGSDLMRPKGYPASNRGRWSSDIRLTMTPTGDGGGTMHQMEVALVPSPVRRPRGNSEPSRWGLHLQVRCEIGTHLGWFSGGDGDRRVARDGGRLASIFSDGTGLDRRLSSLTKTIGSFPLMSPSFSRQRLGSRVANWWLAAVARVRWLLRFTSKIQAKGGTIYKGFDTHA
jgi:hypothetical protein